MQLSLAFQTDHPLNAYGPLAAQVEAYGFDAVTVYNDLLYQPAWLPLLEMARATKHIRLGPAAVNPFTCHPINIAGNIALIDEASHGRAYLGIARGAWLDYLGLEPHQPVTALKESFECVRHLLQQSTAPYNGQVFKLAGGDSLRWKILRSQIPFLLGAWGAKTIGACIGLVNEIKIGGTANPLVIGRVRDQINVAAKQAGRQPESVSLVVGAVCVVDDDGATARARARSKVALYLPVVAKLDQTLELDPDLLKKIEQAAQEFKFEQAASFISDELLSRFAFAGTPHEVAEQAQALVAAGADRIEFGTPHGLSEGEGLRLLGEKVLPILKPHP